MSKYRRYFEAYKNPVFITFVTYNRRNILIQNISVLKNSFLYAKSKYKFDIIAISVLENHCHFILYAENSQEVPQIIRTIKFNFSVNIPDKYICENLSQSTIKRGEKGIWQRRYYDHIIRDKEDFLRHIDYIHYNSWKHYNIAPKDWKYSSFDKFVKRNCYDIDWCNFNNEHNIDQLNYE